MPGILAEVGFEGVDDIDMEGVGGPDVRAGDGLVDEQGVVAGIAHFRAFDDVGCPKRVAARSEDKHGIDIFGLVFELDGFVEAVGVAHEQLGGELALEALAFEEHAGVVGVVARVADGQVHVVSVAGIDDALGGKFHGVAVVFDAVRATAVAIGDVVGGIGAAIAGAAAAAAGAAVHRVDGDGQALGIRGGNRAGNHGHIARGGDARHRVGTGEQEDEQVVVAGAHERRVLFRTEDVVEGERVGVGEEVEVQCRAVHHGVALVVLLK